MLCDDNFFTGDSFQEQLEVAYEDFMAFTRARKIPHSQKMFTPRFVSQPELFINSKCRHVDYNNHLSTRMCTTNPGLPLPSAQVVKKDGQLLMTGKAYNNRIICEWLHDALRRACLVSADPRMPIAYLMMTFS